MSGKEIGNAPPSAASKSTRCSYVTLPLGIRVNRRSLYIGSSSFALVLLLLMAVCLYAFSKYQADAQHALTLVEPLPVQGRSPVAQQILAEAAQGSIADAEEAGAVTVQSILASYRTASGLSELQSLIVHGSYLEGGRTFSMDLAAKAPGLVRKTLSDPTTKITCSFDGEAVQIKVEDPTGQGATQQVQDALYRQPICGRAPSMHTRNLWYNSIFFTSSIVLMRCLNLLRN